MLFHVICIKGDFYYHSPKKVFVAINIKMSHPMINDKNFVVGFRVPQKIFCKLGPLLGHLYHLGESKT